MVELQCVKIIDCCRRDLKVENLLLDDQLNIKIIGHDESL